MKLLTFPLTALVIFGLVSCDDEPRPLWKKDGVRYFATPDDPRACEEVLPRLLAYREQVADFLGSSPPKKLDYFKYPDLWAFRQGAPCSSRGVGCFDVNLGAVYTRYALHRHELAHEVAGHDSSTAFNEALATALSCAPSVPINWADSDDLTYPFVSSVVDSYEAWGALVTELLRRGGLKELKELELRYEDGGATTTSLNDGLLAIYGIELESLWSEIVGAGRSTCLPLGRCDAPAVEVGVNLISEECDGIHERVLDDSLGRAVGVTPGEAPVFFIACDLDAPPWEVQRDYLWRYEITEFVIRTPSTPHLLTREQTASADVSVSVRKLEGVFGESCEEVEDGLLSFGDSISQRLVIPEGDGDTWFHIAAPPSPATFRLFANDHLNEEKHLFLCDACPSSLEKDCRQLGDGWDVPDSDFFLLASRSAGGQGSFSVTLELEN